MLIYVYDFDGTIYNGDSSLDFFIFTLRKYPVSIFRIMPRLSIGFAMYFFKKIEKKKLKELFFSFLKYIPDINSYTEIFWKENYHKIKDWYLKKENHSQDVIVSASPYFLLENPAKKIGIYKLIASNFNSNSGLLVGENCYGEEKVNRISQECPDCLIEEFYTDSESDKYLARLSRRAFWVKGDLIKGFPSNIL